jgi:hypothetical protein
MGQVGRPPKPIEQKRRTGNPGKRALPKAEVVALPSAFCAPEPHRPLGSVGRDVWDRTWRACGAWLKPESDAEQVLIVAELSDERHRLRVHVLQNPDDWRTRKALRELEKLLQSGLSTLGMTPVDRSRLGVSEVKENPFAKLHAEIAAKRAAAKP